MQYEEFTNKIIKDLESLFDEVRIDNEDRIYIAKGVTNVSVPIKPMYQEYLLYGYIKNLKNYLKIINNILDTYKFKLDLSNVFPLIKQKTNDNNISKNFIEKDLFCNLKIMYVSDLGEVFRFVLKEDLKNARLDIEPSLGFKGNVLKKLEKKDKALFEYLNSLPDNPVYRQINEFRNNIVHNYRPNQIDSGFTRTINPDGSKIITMSVGNYTTSTEFLNNIKDSLDLLADITDVIRVKIKT